MYCKNHPGIEAGYACTDCGHPICLQCTVELKGKSFCRECLEKRLEGKPTETERNIVPARKKSRFWTFVLGWVPGAGHMYLGLMNKGLTLMGFYFGLLFSLVILAEALHMNWMNILIAPLSIICVFYSLFDSLATVNSINSGVLVRDTELNIMELSLLKEKIAAKRNTIGYVLVIIGCIGLVNIFTDAISQFINRFMWKWFYFSPSSLIMPIILIVLGLYLLKKSRNISN